MVDIQHEMDAFAAALAKKAKLDKTPLQEATDAFKALTGYYAARHKVMLKSDVEDEDNSFSFGEKPNGGSGPKIPARRNS